MKIKNTSERAVPLGRVTISPGKVEDLPDDLMCHPSPARLLRNGVLKRQTLEEPKEPEKVVLEISTEIKVEDEVLVDEIAEDDLTTLENVGRAREKTLLDNGITSFQMVVDTGSEALATLFKSDISVAEKIVESAKAKLNG